MEVFNIKNVKCFLAVFFAITLVAVGFVPMNKIDIALNDPIKAVSNVKATRSGRKKSNINNCPSTVYIYPKDHNQNASTRIISRKIYNVWKERITT